MKAKDIKQGKAIQSKIKGKPKKGKGKQGRGKQRQVSPRAASCSQVVGVVPGIVFAVY